MSGIGEKTKKKFLPLFSRERKFRHEKIDDNLFVLKNRLFKGRNESKKLFSFNFSNSTFIREVGQNLNIYLLESIK